MCVCVCARQHSETERGKGAERQRQRSSVPAPPAAPPLFHSLSSPLSLPSYSLSPSLSSSLSPPPSLPPDPVHYAPESHTVHASKSTMPLPGTSPRRTKSIRVYCVFAAYKPGRHDKSSVMLQLLSGSAVTAGLEPGSARSPYRNSGGRQGVATRARSRSAAFGRRRRAVASNRRLLGLSTQPAVRPHPMAVCGGGAEQGRAPPQRDRCTPGCIAHVPRGHPTHLHVHGSMHLRQFSACEIHFQGSIFEEKIALRAP